MGGILDALALGKPKGTKRRGRFILGRALIFIVILAAVTLLAPFVYSIWLVMNGHIGAI